MCCSTSPSGASGEPKPSRGATSPKSVNARAISGRRPSHGTAAPSRTTVTKSRAIITRSTPSIANSPVISGCEALAVRSNSSGGPFVNLRPARIRSALGFGVCSNSTIAIGMSGRRPDGFEQSRVAAAKRLPIAGVGGLRHFPAGDFPIIGSERPFDDGEEMGFFPLNVLTVRARQLATGPDQILAQLHGAPFRDVSEHL